MGALHLILIAAIFGFVNAESGLQYTIQNTESGLYLTNFNGEDQLCKPLSFITTEKLAEQPDVQKWVVHYWGNVPEQFGFHLIGKHQMNEITFDIQWPPYCYPVYVSFDILNENGLIKDAPVVIKSREHGCLASKGAGQRIEWSSCDANSQAQLWSFKRVE